MPKSMEKVNQPVITDDVVEVETKVAKKKFANDDEIECVSITPGQLFVNGERSKELYSFADIDDVQYLRYDDLLYLTRRKHPSVFKPRFIIKDADFLAQNKEVEELYASLYTNTDLKSILKMSPAQMKTKIQSLPQGAKDSLMIIAMTMIDNGTLDSIQRIKVLDELFGTNMLFKLTGN